MEHQLKREAKIHDIGFQADAIKGILTERSTPSIEGLASN